ncbi:MULTISPECIES: DEAD/DEAH box helicase [unclassified Coleofasciculus]|uniref:DEAD/DEAH box helicase n=1 Tax=unclassified Coleofasciculus TaxID=2692782 RepID=UPI00187E7959|nr:MULTISPECIES: DEAD/DEAH box helicase [unclassified Coleofasciculus]MBE9124587.1 DEAD/DEAH box helicase [Coleofasciculus sp. LEGE 07081]MBE9147550.1 DEAD/DEAH box helicase [Coleofasciculus sp. LEGE 07092]
MNVSTRSIELDLKNLFPFELDQFQQQAIAALNVGRSVVVCTPTGSGKTLIGEYTIYRALARGGRVFYTTPLKALSNQKLRDFRAAFGVEQVGLVTGDISVNRDAPILVMTTEIFRNMLYGTPIGEIGTSLEGVEAVVLDECHYMNDRQRGTVWEESIIYCPPEIQLVALSATIANADQLTDWLNLVHGSTELIYSNFRPVPLQFSFGNPKGLFPLLDSSQTKINPRLKPKRQKGRGRGGRPESPSLPYVIEQLRQRDMLPAIYFIFSRRGCDRSVEELGDLSLVNQREASDLKERIDRFLSHNLEVGRAGQVEPLSRGIAAHHAGILPAWKAFVEELFQLGLVKVVFATETLAAGINMPARTTVISSLSKRTDRGHRLLTPSEFLQMAGRAGRRGMDTIGYVVTLQTPFEGAKEAAYLATTGADPLVSQFTPTYGMVLNLLQTHTLNRSKDLVERSFAQYLATLYLKPQQQAITELTTELTKLDIQLAPVDLAALSNYAKLKERLKEERRLLKTLQRQAEAVKASEIAHALQDTHPGTLFALKGKYVPVPAPIPAVLIAKEKGRGQFPYLVCLSADNRWYVATTADVSGWYGELPVRGIAALVPPIELSLKPGQVRSGSPETEAIAAQIPRAVEIAVPPEVVAQQQVVEAVAAQIENHLMQQWGNPSQLLKRHKRRLALQEEINQRQAEFRENQAQNWREFLNLMEILRAFGCLENVTPTSLGQAAAAIRGDNELWVGLAMMSGEFDELDPHHLAAVACALVTETPRPDSWTNYLPPEPVIQALEALKQTRRQLFQLQRRYDVALPVWLERDLIGIVEQWALGVEWTELCANTSLDEGDIVRMLRRTVELLSQIPHVPPLSNSLKRNAIRAIQLLERFPVNEVAASGR